MKYRAVIGANYGDEGKGLVTDYLSSSSSLVVRFNGGAQAGHTVVSNKGPEHRVRHVFHHLGSGTLQGADTYLSKFFIVNPLLFRKEHELLKGGFPTKIYADHKCMMSTPIDMMINQALESSRPSRHGSCGLGINETVNRNHKDSDFKLSLEDFYCMSTRGIEDWLGVLRHEYLPKRLEILNLPSLLPNATESLKTLHEWFPLELNYFRRNVDLRMFSSLANESYYEDIVFEGAQGLYLDMDSPAYPHVTRSKTGLRNVLWLLNDLDIKHEDLEIYFVSRPYLTRHGEGPLLNEVSFPPYSTIVDETNIPNEWQGKIRYGLLDPDILANHLASEVADYGLVNYNLVMTCLDQVAGTEMNVMRGSKLTKISLEVLRDIFKNYGFLKDLYYSMGPSREYIKKLT